MSRMSRLKRDQINQSVQGLGLDGDEREEKKFQNLLNDDGVISQVYQEVYKEVRHQDQGESDYLRALHEKFDYYYDKECMEDKLPSEMYDLNKWDKEAEMQFSTDFSDEEDEIQYK